MASQSLLNQSIMNLENTYFELDETMSILDNECSLETLVGNPGGLYPENVEYWEEYGALLNKVISRAIELQVRLSMELIKVNDTDKLEVDNESE